MKVLLRLAPFALLGAGLLMAAPTCLPGQPNSLTSLGTIGCEYSDKLFSNFLFDGLRPGTRVTFTGGFDLITLTFTGPGNSDLITGVNSNQPATITIGYTVQTLPVPNGPATIIDLGLGTGTLTTNGNATGTVNAQEWGCFGLVPGCGPGVFDVHLQVAGPNGHDGVEFRPPVNAVTVFKTATVTATGAGEVALSSLTNEVSQIPEPGSLTMVGGLALALLGVYRRLRS